MDGVKEVRKFFPDHCPSHSDMHLSHHNKADELKNLTFLVRIKQKEHKSYARDINL